jgi:hypothetical protein
MGEGEGKSAIRIGKSQAAARAVHAESARAAADLVPTGLSKEKTRNNVNSAGSD